MRKVLQKEKSDIVCENSCAKNRKQYILSNALEHKDATELEVHLGRKSPCDLQYLIDPRKVSEVMER